MTMKKFLTLLLAATFALALACGKGKEVSKAEDEGEDDQQAQTTTTAAGSEGTTAPAATAASAPAVADAATLTGTIKFAGAAPQMPTIQMNADPYCQSQHASTPATDEEVVVGAGGELANVIVFIKNAPAGTPTSTPAVIDQHGCQYHPHVQAVEVGQPIQIKNSDATLHNIHAMPVVNSAFNEGQPVQGMVSTKKFDKPELVPFKIKCDVHGWMKSFMVVLPHPYHGVSGMDGKFTIGNLPPGSYTVVAWHEKYGTQEQNITVAPKEAKTVDFTFKG
jgi:plastocyanin